MCTLHSDGVRNTMCYYKAVHREMHQESLHIHSLTPYCVVDHLLM